MNKKQTLIALSTTALGTIIYNVLKPVKSDVQAISNFDIDQYLGKWYEIARLDFYWEKNLKNVVAEYRKDTSGRIQVINKGVDITNNQLKIKTGKAKFKFPDDKNIGALKVSFFGPFYSGYHVMAIDEGYKYALVFGDNTDYMWILSREKDIPKKVVEGFLKTAQMAGYATENLVWTVQEDS